MSGWWVATWCVTGWQLIQAERERESREWRECRCPVCVQPTLRNHHSPPGLPRRLPATLRAETVQIRPRGTGISGLLYQSEQPSQHNLSWKISSTPSRAKAQLLKWSSMKTGARLRQVEAKKDSKHGKRKILPHA